MMKCVRAAALFVVGLIHGSIPVAAATFLVITTEDSGPGSLRQAILDANAASDGLENRIEFQLPGSSPYRIQPLSSLPDLRGPAVIDGFTQPGFSGRPLIEINGDRAGEADGLRLGGGYVRVQGLIINSFQGAGIRCLDGTNTIRGNFIGTDPTGKISQGNGEAGIDLFLGDGGNIIGGPNSADRNVISGNRWGLYLLSPDNIVQGNVIGLDVDAATALGNVTGLSLVRAVHATIGGINPGQGNVISGNSATGIECLGGFSDGPAQNVIQGNLIGLNGAGTAALGNGQHGISLGANATDNLIGGTTAAAQNVIAGNGAHGILIVGAKPGNQILGNAIGVDITGTNALPNGGNGIEILAAGQTIGGPQAGAGNLIAFNALAGVAIEDGTNNLISGNRIFGNGRLNIALGTNGPVANDDGDLDEGPNHLQNSPDLTSSLLTADTIQFQGTLRGRPGATCTLEFFASPTCDASGAGAGFLILGRTNLAMTTTGTADFSMTLSNSVSPGWQLTATATDDAGNTSGFSTCLPLATEIRTVPAFVLHPLSQSVVAGGSVTFSAAITGEPGPFEYELRAGTASILTNRTPDRQVFLTLPAVRPNDAGSYRILVRSPATAGPGVASKTATLTVLPDADGDGLPDVWESAHGLNTNNAADASLDLDGDGFTNLQEYLADTDPTNRLSNLQLQFSRDASGAQPALVLSFTAVSNKTYSVQFREGLSQGAWSNMLQWVARTTNATVSSTNVIGPGLERYFRIVSPAQP